MRPDLHEVLTENARNGLSCQNLKKPECGSRIEEHDKSVIRQPYE
jgi:hypothetical protein